MNFSERQIDQMVYELYGLNKDEVKIVESCIESLKYVADGVVTIYLWSI